MGTPAPDAAGALAARELVGKLLKAAMEGNLAAFKDAANQIAQGQELATALAAVKDANDRGCLHFAARAGQNEICRYLVEDVHLPVDAIDMDGETPVIHAARLGFVSTAQYLLDHGADANAKALASSTSAIHHAAGTGSLELIGLLLDKGVHVDTASSSGTPLTWAAGHGRVEAVKLLLERGANPDATCEDDVTAILTAAAAKSFEVLQLLVKSGANVNVAAGGVTALHIAAEQGDVDMIECLIGAGADTNVIDDDGATPIQAAAVGGNWNVVELLLPVTKPLSSIPEWTVNGFRCYTEELQAAEAAPGQGPSLDTGRNVQQPQITEVTFERQQDSLKAKARGTAAFKKGNFMDAIDGYTQANDLDPTNAEILANRSLCWMRVGQAEQALTDAQAARRLAPHWSKTYYREGSALRLLQRFDEAAAAFYSGVKIDPENKELISAFQEAVEAGKKFHGTG